MKITGSQFQQIQRTYQKNRHQRTNGSEPVKNDKVNFSNEAKGLSRINELLTQTPEIRLEKVTQLKMAIQQGTYEIKGEKVAEKMIEQHYLDKVR